MAGLSLRKILFVLGPVLVLILIFAWWLTARQKRFDQGLLSIDGVLQNIEELSSVKYAGRLAGSQGNQLALKYIENYFRQIGLEPAGEGGTYYQEFKSVVPVLESKPAFRVLDSSGKSLREFTYGSDFREELADSGGGGEVSGELFYASTYIKTYRPEELKNKIVVFKLTLEERDIQYALDSGVKAIVALSSPFKRPFAIDTKPGQTLPIIRVSPQVYSGVVKSALEGRTAQLTVDVAFKPLSTPNIFGKIEGKDKQAGYVIISGIVDGLGSDFDGSFFPGAFDGASGMAMVMELAKILKEQKQAPDKTIIFAGWNNQEYGSMGTRYYADNPIYPLERTQVVVLNRIGGEGSESLRLDAAGSLGKLLSSLLGQYASDDGVGTKQISSRGADHWPFAQRDIPAVLLSDNYLDPMSRLVHTYDDNTGHISRQSLAMASTLLLSYLRREVYQDHLPDYLQHGDKLFLLGFGFGLLAIYLIHSLNRLNPGLGAGGIKVEDVYYSRLFQLVQKVYSYGAPAMLILFSLVLIANIPSNFNLVLAEGKTYSNLSLFLVFKHSTAYLHNLLSHGLGTSRFNASVISVVGPALARSALLLLASLFCAFLFGTLKGIRDGFRHKGTGNLRTLGTLLALSLPDVFIVVLIQVGLVWLYDHNLLAFFNKHAELQRFLAAFACLTLLPTIYISRIAATAVQSEIKRDYIKAARAKGLSGFYLVKNHLLISTVVKVVDSLSPVLTMVISNLIIVEFLLYYPGIVYALLKAYELNDTVPFIGASLSLGLMYIIFNLLFRLASRSINPLKKGGLL